MKYRERNKCVVWNCLLHKSIGTQQLHIQLPIDLPAKDSVSSVVSGLVCGPVRGGLVRVVGRFGSVGGLGTGGKADGAAGDLDVGSAHTVLVRVALGGHDHGAADDGLGAREVDVGRQLNAGDSVVATDGAENAASGGLLLSVAVAGHAHVGVKDGAGGGAAVAEVAQSVDGQLDFTSETVNFTPHLGLDVLGALRHADYTAHVGLLLGVLEDALGVDGLVEALVGVRSCLNAVAVVGDEDLGHTRAVEDLIAVVSVGGVSGLAVAIVAAVASAVTTEALAADSEAVAEALAAEALAADSEAVAAVTAVLGRVVVAEVPLGGDCGGNKCEGELHF